MNMTLAQIKEKRILDPWKKYSGDFVSAKLNSGATGS
jgi:hypothetical protein